MAETIHPDIEQFEGTCPLQGDQLRKPTGADQRLSERPTRADTSASRRRPKKLWIKSLLQPPTHCPPSSPGMDVPKALSAGTKPADQPGAPILALTKAGQMLGLRRHFPKNIFKDPRTPTIRPYYASSLLVFICMALLSPRRLTHFTSIQRYAPNLLTSSNVAWSLPRRKKADPACDSTQLERRFTISAPKSIPRQFADCLNLWSAAI